MNTTAESARCCEAEVIAHGHRIRYSRLGVGRPVIVLGPERLQPPLGPAFLDALSSCFTIFRPVPGDDAADLVGWLLCFLEGLGTSDNALVAAGRFAWVAREVASAAPHQVTRLVLVEPEELRPEMETRPPAAVDDSLPALVLGRDPASGNPGAEIATRIASFLGCGVGAEGA